jgi:hypothetical protein
VAVNWIERVMIAAVVVVFAAAFVGAVLAFLRQ